MSTKHIAILFFAMAAAAFSVGGVEVELAMNTEYRAMASVGLFAGKPAVGITGGSIGDNLYLGSYYGEASDWDFTERWGGRIGKRTGVVYLTEAERIGLLTGVQVGIYYRWLTLWIGHNAIAYWCKGGKTAGSWAIGITYEKPFFCP